MRLEGFCEIQFIHNLPFSIFFFTVRNRFSLTVPGNAVTDKRETSHRNMQENTTIAEVINDETAPEFVSTTGGDSIHQDLEAWFTSQEDAQQIQQVDNSISDAENDTTEDLPAEETTDTPEETAETADKSVEETDPATETANFDALENPDKQEIAPSVDYPDEEALKVKYPRQSNALIAETAQYAAQAQKGNEVINKLGGEEFIEPVATIVTGLKEGNPSQFFQGIIEASDPDMLVDIIGNAMNVAMVKSKDFINDSDANTKLFGEKLQAATDVIIQNRLGEGFSLEKLETLTEFQKHGWLDAIDRWKENGFVDPDEFDELCEGDKEPAKFQSLKQELAEKNSQLAQFESKLKDSETKQVAQVEVDFDKENGAALEKVLTDVVLKTSVLRDVKGDSPELKEEKQILREVLKGEAAKALKNSTARKDLLESYKSGKSTKDYGSKLTTAINSAVLQTKEMTTFFERIVAKLYRQTRNGNLKDSPTNNAEKLLPTQTTKPVTNGTKTIRDIDKEFEQFFAGQS